MATESKDQVIIYWVTATETGNRGFEIERTMLKSWEKIGYVPGKGTTTEKQTYGFVDKTVNNYVGELSYRLKQIDFNGSYNYSNTITIKIDFSVKEYSLSQNYPNPFNPTTIIKYAIPFESQVIIKFYNSLGQNVREINPGTMQPGYYKLNFNSSGLASGIYYYAIKAVSTDGKNNFSAVKKMILVK